MRKYILAILMFTVLACGSSTAKKENTKAEKPAVENKQTGNTEQKENEKSTTASVSESDGDPLKIRKGKVDMQFYIKGLDHEGQTLDLIGMYMDKKYLADSTVIEPGGKFSFKGDKLYPDGFYYIVLPGNKVIKLLIDKDQTFTFEADINDIDHTAKIDGSLTMKLYYDDFKFKKDLDPEYARISRKIGRMSPSDPEFDKTYKEFLAISKKYEDRNKWLQKKYPDNFFTKFKIGGKNPILTFPKDKNGELDVKKQVYEYRKHFWDDFDFNVPALVNTPAFPNKLNRYFTELIPQNQDSIIKYTDVLMDMAGHNDEYYKIISNWVALKYEPGKTKLMDGEAVYSHVILKYFTKDRAKWLDDASRTTLRKRASEMVQSLLNKKAGNVTARGYDGKMYTLYDIKAPVILVYIYNPDCSHCEEETPKLVNFYRQHKDKGVEIFSIAANTTEPEWRAFHERFHLPWIDVFDATNASWYPKYFVDVTPELYVLDKDRKIVAKNLHVNQLETILQRINK